MRLTTRFLLAGLLFGTLASAQPIILFPGDTNNDGVANHFDLLPIGVAYGQIGPLRIPAFPNWAPQILEEPWDGTLPVSGINLGFLDCDGNGILDSTDIESIVFNFDSTQNIAMPPPLPYPLLLTDTCFSCPKPDFLITFSADTVITGQGMPDTLFAYIQYLYPSNVPPQNGALGIAFDVEYEYDPGKIVDAQTDVFPDLFPDDRMYVIATSTEAQFWRLPSPGSMGFATAGRGQNVFFGADTLFVVRFVIEDLIVRGGVEKFSINLTNFLLVNHLEQIVCPGAVKRESVTIVSTAAPAGPRVSVQLSPNPVRDMLVVESPETPLLRIEVCDPGGKPVLARTVGGLHRCEVPVSALPPGVWLLRAQTRTGFVLKKFVKIG
ncbi:MAG: T9SS type A sorting domain-containing protein [Lewinellaceae bacterium]|nr:T9SS type A sorting domain-containing protein [Lewinellaceae bacterium]